MNLIEELGGYECAKAEYNDPMYEDGELYTIKATGTRFFKHNLADELLEYRRENNIFEDGDKVLIDGHDRVYMIDTINSDGFHGTTITNPKRCIIHIFNDIEVIHATPEEIKAGHRL